MAVNEGSSDSTENRIIRVVIIEDENQIREGLAQLIGATPDFQCTGLFSTAEAALRGIGSQAPDVALVDIGLPGMSGIEAVKRLKDQHPSLLFLMLTVYEDNERIFDALCAGACGYLLKKTPHPKLLEAIREAVAGGSPMSPEIARRVISLFREIRPPARAEHDLTPHEIRLLKLIVQGHNYKTAAVELGVTFNTISYHMRHIYEKLQVHSKSEAVARAIQDRIV
jgi:DNA-binding NarL/FixJ family response regulator